jgi:AcrR family transcriptional regulator
MADTAMSNAERSRATREALLVTARELFAQRGYADVGTEEIVRAAGVTRGALYHHFAGKQELFEAVYEEVERELVQEIAQSAGSAAADALGALHAGTRAFLAACEDPAIQRIALLDAASVLGWERWREVGMKYGMGLMQAVLGEAMDAGLIERQPAEPLAAVLLGAVDEGAMVIARADDDGQTRASVEATLARFIDSLACAPSRGEGPRRAARRR